MVVFSAPIQQRATVMNVLLSTAPCVAEEIMDCYYCGHHPDRLLSRLAQSVTWIEADGWSAGEYAVVRKRLASLMKTRRTTGFSLKEKKCQLVNRDKCSCVVAASCHVVTDTGTVLWMPCWSLVFRVVGDALSLVFVHISRKESGPFRSEGLTPPDRVSESGDYEQVCRCLADKTRQFSLLSSILRAGLKTSLLDEEHTLLYVNEELCRLLGYSEEELLTLCHGHMAELVYPPDLPAAREKHRRDLAGSPFFSLEYRIRHKDGSLIWVWDRGHATRDQEGRDILNSVIVDITAQKEAQETIQRQKAFFQSHYDTIPCGLVRFTLDDDPVLLTANQMAYQIIGYSKNDFSPDFPCTLFAFVHPDDYAMVKERIHRIIQTREADNLTYRVVHKSDDARWFNASLNIVPDMDGTLILQAVYSDVTSMQRLQQEQNATYENIPGGVVKYLVDKRVRLVEANEHYYRLMGTTKETFHSQALDSVLPEDRASMYATFLEKAAALEPVDLEFRSVRFDNGGIVWLHLLGRFVGMRGASKLYQCVIIDITVQKKTQLQLDQERERYRIVMENSAQVVYEYDLRTDVAVLYENRRYGTRIEVIRYETPNFRKVLEDTTVLHPEDLPLALRFFSGEESYMVELRFGDRYAPEKGYVWCQLQGTLIYEKDVPARIVGSIRDIDESRKLKEEKEALQDIFNQELSRDYENICRIDTASGEYVLYTSGDVPYHNIPFRGDYTTSLKKLTEEMVCVQDRSQYWHDLQISTMMQVLDSGRKEGEVYYRGVGKDGHLRWKSVRYTYFRQNRDTLLLNVRDIHDIRVAQQREENRFYILLREACEKVVEVDPETAQYSLYLPENKYPLEKCGTYAEMLQCYANRYVLKEERETFLQHLSLSAIEEHLYTGKEYSVDFTVQEKNGSLSYKNWNTFLCHYDDKVYYLAYVRDVTGRVLELWEKEREAEKNRRIIKDALDAAEQANSAKSEFLSKMSHEIRTPMNAIIGVADIMKVSLDNRKKMLDCLEKIGSSSRFLLSLLNDILDMSRIESGKVAIAATEFDMMEFVGSITSLIWPQARDKGIAFDIDMETVQGKRYIADTLRLKQVIVNLLSNALKFTPKGGSIAFRIQETRQVKEHVYLLIVVSDTGIGIPCDRWEHIFEPFEQAEASIAQRFGGSGLGLSISKNLVSLMNGHISVRSVPGKGSDFLVELPVEMVRKPLSEKYCQSKDVSEQEPGESEYDFTGCRILLVEDNDLNLEIAQTLLEFKKATVDTARNGQEAVDAFAASPQDFYDFILMDVRMPIKNGLEATREIRAMPRPDAASIPILAMTANAFAEDVEESRRSGMTEHLPKPIETNVLYTRLYTYWKHRKIGPNNDSTR